MWRLSGLLGRALPRLLGSDLQSVTPKSTSPDGPQAAASTLLVPVPNFQRSRTHGPGTRRGPRNHGWKDAFHWMSARVSPNTLWDALSWGTLAVLALQLARQIHSQASLPAGPQQPEHCSWRSPLDRFLPSAPWQPHSSLRRHILPLANGPTPAPNPGYTGLGDSRHSPEEPLTRPQSISLRSPLEAAGLQDLSEEGPGDWALLHASSSSDSTATAAQPGPLGDRKEQDTSAALPLEEAVTSIQQLFELSVSIAFNFLGTENVRNGDDAAAFSYFQKAADRGYSKAQYNVGLCHERGRGTPRDLSKAVLYYQLAASQGHGLAQYRCARCLLQGSTSSWDAERQRAMSMLEQAADSGLREAQAFLGVLFTKEPHLDEQRAVKYLQLAADNGDSQSRYHLGICYEKGLGVQRSLGEAVRCYRQSAALGNQPAQERLRTLFAVKAAAPGPSNLAVTGLKSFSSPSLCSLNTLLVGASCLPHASSTGNLGLLCRSRHLGAPSRTAPSLERSLLRLGFG
ncbi:death ligand signal enhancer [Lepus europaeus]|uniref:death ligand signal enhancer n=1 Tax=Lepus europaeus TaxID=9983 RepID=UPI002B4896AA|nr:death ligand signal enhancer [Lepus europaeus]XP_062044915.1 death ligand signal enhancer [Lepus europaeus]